MTMSLHWITRDNCLICGSQKLKGIRTEPNRKIGRKYADPYLEGSLTLVECADCKMAFVHSLPGEEHFFSDLYADDGRDVSLDFDYSGKLRIFEHTLRVLTRYKLSGRLLDIGTGTGVWLSYASKFFTCQGIEIGKRASEVGKNRGLDIKNEENFGTELPSGSFDVVTMIDVLEHVPDPKSVILNCHRLLKKDGIFLIKVPNYRSQALKQNFLKTFHLSDVGIMENYVHINHFCPESLSNALKNNGFEVLTCEPAEPELWHKDHPGSFRQKCKRVVRDVAVLTGSQIIRTFFGVNGAFNFCAVARKVN